MSENAIKKARVLDALFHELAVEVSKSRFLTEKELNDFDIQLDDAVKKLESQARQAIAEARRNRLAQARYERLASERTLSFRKFAGLSKEAIVARLSQLQLEFPGRLQVEHRDLNACSEDDLRSLLADFEDLLSDGS